MGLVSPRRVLISRPVLLRYIFRHFARTPSVARRRSLCAQVQKRLGHVQEAGSFEVSSWPERGS